MTWGKVDPQQLPDAVTCYMDSTVALPLLTAYALAKREKRPPKRLMDRLGDVTAAMEAAYLERRGAVRPE
jgi:deoxyhypusine synthase